MNILQRIQTAYASLAGQPIYSQYDLRRLAQFARSKQGLSLTADLIRATDNLTKKDIDTWRMAWQQALNIDNPSRTLLYDIYRDNLVDLHLQGCINQRQNIILGENFRLVGNDGTINEHATACLQQEWFRDYCRLVLDSILWGHSLIQFGDICQQNGTPAFRNVELVPRKHVCPEYGVLLRQIGDDPRTGIPYREGELSLWSLEAGKKDDLGLLLACSPQCISKRNMLAFWDMFGEIFGAPMRIAKATTTDENERRKIEQALTDMGAAFWGLFPEGTEIEIKESSRGDAYQVFDKRIDRCNSELSKGVLGQTMTIDNGSSRSQAETHLTVFEDLIRADKQLLKNHINNCLLPLMLRHGFPVSGCTFEWEEQSPYTTTEQIEIERNLLLYYDIDPNYFKNKYGIDITGKRELLTPDANMMQHLTAGQPDFFA